MVLSEEKRSTPTVEGVKAYTHGLEQIYKLENVDIRTVRPLKRPSIEQPKMKAEMDVDAPEPELDLGDGFREWMPSVILQEPLRVLGLSQHALQTLEEHSLRQIKDVIKKAPEDFIYLKGLGQGHIDEILQKLDAYVGGKSLDRVNSVDFAGFLRCLLSKQSTKEAVLLLEPYQLSHLFQLTSGEEAELRHLSKEQKRKVADEARETLQQERAYFDSEFNAIASAFLIPWMERRLGLATGTELLERLEKVAADSAMVTRSMAFFSLTFCEGASPFRQVCPSIDGGFASSPAIAEAVERTIADAISYFYTPTIEYPLAELSSHIEREQARGWEGSEEGFVEKTLRYSPQFQFYRGRCGTLWVRRST